VIHESAREHLLNADFDLSLAPGWPGSMPPELRRQVDELALHALLVAAPGDSVLVAEPPPEELLAHLEAHGIAPPELTVRPAVRAERCLAPYGWNDEAARLSLRYDHPVDHPPVEVVRRVNGRSWGAALERRLDGREHALGTARSIEAVQALAAGPPEGVVVKAEHGNAGLGNRRIAPGGLSRVDRRVVGRLLEGGQVLVERWYRRCLDLSTTFEVDAAGLVRSVHVHEVVTTADGAFIGALFEPEPRRLLPWRAELEEMAARVGAALYAEGYHGPVCVDSFTWRDGATERLRPLVEVNARGHISSGALALWRRRGGRGVVYWRFFSRRKLVAAPDRLAAFQAALGEDALGAAGPGGVLVTSPLRLGSGRRPHKLGALLIGSSRDEVLALEHRLRTRFER
jgi:hypothetical protein